MFVIITSRSETEYKRSKGARKQVEHLEDFVDSDGDEDTTSKVTSKKPAKAVKRKAPTSKRSPPAATKSGWPIDTDSEEEAVVRRQGSESQSLQSTLSRRVADGVLRRTAQRDGDVYIELKVYNTKEILKVEPKDRWEQAVISLKYQADSDAPELIPLKEVIKLCKTNFTGEGKFFSSKKSKT